MLVPGPARNICVDDGGQNYSGDYSYNKARDVSAIILRIERAVLQIRLQLYKNVEACAQTCACKRREPWICEKALQLSKDICGKMEQRNGDIHGVCVGDGEADAVVFAVCSGVFSSCFFTELAT